MHSGSKEYCETGSTTSQLSPVYANLQHCSFKELVQNVLITFHYHSIPRFVGLAINVLLLFAYRQLFEEEDVTCQ